MEMIGIVGGVGPYAGLDLAGSVFDQTMANKDQDHLPMTIMSLPEKINDRTEYLLGKVAENPAFAVSKILLQMESVGVTVAGIPCNTMHSPKIFDVIKQELTEAGSKVKLIHMIQEVMTFLNDRQPEIKNIGVLSTTGTHNTGIYYSALERTGYQPVIPSKELQTEIHEAVYHPEYGIKAQSQNPSKEAINILKKGIDIFKEKGARGVILGCTEIAYALPYKTLQGITLLNATQILARALIRETYPEKILDPNN